MRNEYAPDRLRTLRFVAGAFAVALALAVLSLVLYGHGRFGTDQALRITARFSFLLFWPTYAGGLFRRFDIPVLSSLARLRREFGLGFASAHSVHVVLIVWRYYIGAPASIDVLIIDGIGILWMYALVAFSLARLRQALGPVAWRTLFNIGLEWIAYVFLSDFLIFALSRGRATSLAYLPFTILLLGAAAGRWSLAVRWLWLRARGGFRVPELDAPSRTSLPGGATPARHS